MSTAIVTAPIEEKSAAIVQQANDIVIDTQESYVVATDFLRNVKTAMKLVDETFDPAIKAAHTAHKTLVSEKKKYSEPLENAERAVKIKMVEYTTKQERIRQEQEAKLRAELVRQEEERRLAEAKRLQDAGKVEQAEAIIGQPIVAPPVVLPKAAPSVSGIKQRKVWKWRLTDENAVPREYMVVDEQKIGAVVRSLGDKAKIAGIEVYEDTIVSASGF